MPDKKLTDSEIVKALELCQLEDTTVCESCPLGKLYPYCDDVLAPVTVDLINRQKAEIERLQEENHIYNEANHIIAYQRNQRDKEIVELQKQIKGLHIYENKIKAEAYKEVFEKLNKKAEVRKIKVFGGLHILKVVLLHDINELKHELVGEDNA